MALLINFMICPFCNEEKESNNTENLIIICKDCLELERFLKKFEHD